MNNFITLHAGPLAEEVVVNVSYIMWFEPRTIDISETKSHEGTTIYFPNGSDIWVAEDYNEVDDKIIRCDVPPVPVFLADKYGEPIKLPFHPNSDGDLFEDVPGLKVDINGPVGTYESGN